MDCLEEALRAHGQPESFNTDPGSPFASTAFTRILLAAGVAISMDGRGRALDNLFVERRRRVKDEDIDLKGDASLPELLLGLTEHFAFDNHERPHQSLGYLTPEAVYRSGEGGGANIVDRFGKAAQERGQRQTAAMDVESPAEIQGKTVLDMGSTLTGGAKKRSVAAEIPEIVPARRSEHRLPGVRVSSAARLAQRKGKRKIARQGIGKKIRSQIAKNLPVSFDTLQSLGPLASNVFVPGILLGRAPGVMQTAQRVIGLARFMATRFPCLSLGPYLIKPG